MSIIKNYGLYWSRGNVNWGKRGAGNAGHLRGYDDAPESFVDFREQAGVYVLYDGADIPSSRVMYIGQAGRANGDALFKRLKDHTDDHLWNRWTRFSWFGVFAVGKDRTLVHTKIDKNAQAPLPDVIDHLEGMLITVLEPVLNKRGANWNAATEYFQWLPEPEVPLASRLAAIEEQLKKIADKG